MPPQIAKWILIAASLLWVAVGLVSVVPAGLSVMLFDAPGSSENPATVIVFWSALTFPLVCAAAAVVPWIFLFNNFPGIACLICACPLLNIAIGGGAWAWIISMQGGRLAG